MVSKQQIETAVLLIFGLPILGIMLGGIYSVPAMKVTGEKDPWLTLLLILSLGCRVLADRPSRKASKEGRSVPSIMVPLTPESFSSEPDNRKSNPKP